VDTHIREGAEIPPYYDSMVAKVITHADDREGALSLMGRALGRFRIEGVTTTVPLHRAVVADDRFRREPVTTRWVEEEFLPSWEQSA
jgi:acetyl-CoA carboxylase biotin carboxylase subunit